MRLRSITLYEVRIPLRIRFRHRLAERAEAHSLLVRIDPAEGPVGWGEAIPRRYLSGETLESASTTILERIWPALSRLELDPESGLLGQLAPFYREADETRTTAAWAGVELALLDLAGKLLSVPVRRFVRERLARNVAPPSPVDSCDAAVPLVAPLGGGSLRALAWQTRCFRWLGFGSFKLKMGYAEDHRRLECVRRIVGPSARLHADANGGWTLDEALAGCALLREADAGHIEQPLGAGETDALAALRATAGLPVMVDESLVTRADAESLLAAGSCDLFNLRLAKNGGVSGCLALLELAQREGLGCQLGALVGETDLLAAGAREFLAATGPLLHHECSFPRLLLAGRPTSGPSANLWRGRMPLAPTGPGLGVRIDEARLRKRTVNLQRAC